MGSKPLGIKAYGSIPHLPQSRMGPGDHSCTEGQANIATVKTRDKYDKVIVQEKLDGSCCAVAKIEGVIVPLTKSGYRAESSRYEQHHMFCGWVLMQTQWERFDALLEERERVVGEWMVQAHGTQYDLPHEPFVAFDIMTEHTRVPHLEATERLSNIFITPCTYSVGPPISIERGMEMLGKHGASGALDPAEGLVWRVERFKNGSYTVDFLVKYVRPDKIDGIYLPEISGIPGNLWNTWHRSLSEKEN